MKLDDHIIDIELTPIEATAHLCMALRVKFIGAM